MQIDAEELQRRLDSPRNLINHLRPNADRKPRAANLTEQERDTIAELSIKHDIPQVEIAEAYGIAESTVSATVTGNIGGRPAAPERAAKRNSLQDEAKDTALTKLMLALGLIDAEKMLECNAKDMSAIAANMAKVHASLSNASQLQAAAGTNVQINIYAPEQKVESKYKVIDV